MSARSFRSVFMVASCAGAALGCYLVSLRVASERSALEEVETKILLAQRDIRLLETEIGTRGRLAQLERWNVKVLALSAPTADQFVDGGFALARLIKPERPAALEAPVVLASAPAAARPQIGGAAEQQEEAKSAPADELLHQASLSRPSRPSGSQAAAPPRPAPEPALTAKPSSSAAAAKKAGDKRDALADRTVTRPARTAKVDPLAPLPAGPSQSRKAADPAR
jgi:hypothetical protein